MHIKKKYICQVQQRKQNLFGRGINLQQRAGHMLSARKRKIYMGARIQLIFSFGLVSYFNTKKIIG